MERGHEERKANTMTRLLELGRQDIHPLEMGSGASQTCLGSKDSATSSNYVIQNSLNCYWTHHSKPS